MRLKSVFAIGFMLLVAFSQSAFAGVAESKGIGEVVYDGWGSASTEDRTAALEKAKLSALERYAAKAGTAKVQNYERVRSEIVGNIDDFIIDYVILSEKDDEDAKRYRIVIRANINGSRFDAALQANSAVSNTAEADRSYITFVFVAREQTSSKRYMDKVYKRKDTAKSLDSKEYESVQGGSADFVGEATSSESATTGGSVTRKADKITYDVSNAEGVNVAMSKALTEAGFEVVDAEYLVDETNGQMSVDAFREDYRHGDDISGGTRRNAVKGLREVGIPYMAVGTLDIGMQDTDPATGMVRVHVTVTGKVLSLKRRFPKTVASVGPVQFAGLGPDQTVARNNALILAAQQAGSTLTQQMNSKGIN